MVGISAIPGTSPSLAQALHSHSTLLAVVPEGADALASKPGIDWQQWAKVSPTMLDSHFMSATFGLGLNLDTYL
jgi:hypothetical protein